MTRSIVLPTRVSAVIPRTVARHVVSESRTGPALHAPNSLAPFTRSPSATPQYRVMFVFLAGIIFFLRFKIYFFVFTLPRGLLNPFDTNKMFGVGGKTRRYKYVRL